MALFGRKNPPPALTPEEARAVLQKASGAGNNETKTILKSLGSLGKDYYNWFGLGCKLHGEYEIEVLKAFRQENPSCCDGGFPSASIFAWENWDFPTMKHLWEATESCSTEVIFVRTTGKRQTKNAFKEMEALRLLSENSSMGMIVFFQENVFLRRNFLIASRGSIPPDSEEILQDLVDYCSSRNIPAGDVW